MAGWDWLDVGVHDDWCWAQSDDGGDGSYSGCDCGNAPAWWVDFHPVPSDRYLAELEAAAPPACSECKARPGHVLGCSKLVLS